LIGKATRSTWQATLEPLPVRADHTFVGLRHDENDTLLFDGTAAGVTADHMAVVR
jgi:hypothetical protein